MMEDLGAAANQALYGKRKGKVGFGKALYEIKEERRKGTNYVYEKAVFYEEVKPKRIKRLPHTLRVPYL